MNLTPSEVRLIEAVRLARAQRRAYYDRVEHYHAQPPGTTAHELSWGVLVEPIALRERETTAAAQLALADAIAEPLR